MKRYRKQSVWGWGRWPRGEASLDRPEWVEEIDPQAYVRDHGTFLARGLGRSYGDQAMNTGAGLLLMTRLDRFLEWDGAAGHLRAEAGASLGQVLEFAVPRGFFLPVTPGTKFVTLGGAIAFDVHGKSQHRDGNFGDHLLGMTVLLPSGEKVWCAPEVEPELFRATVAGMGLTGVILDAKIRLDAITSSRVVVQYRPFQSLEQARDIFLEGDKEFPFTVAWLDQGVERGVATLGRFATREEAARDDPFPVHWPPRKRVPITTPAFLLNRLFMGLFYRLYYRLQSRKGTRLEHYDKFFYPLDGIDDWNRLYGRAGFLQYQVVLPMETGLDTIRSIVKLLRSKGCRPCLAVLKLFGDKGRGLLSFPAKGFTLALDLPVRGRLLKALEEADRITLEGGGRVYLAKDSRMKPETVRAMYPRLEEWSAARRKADPEGRLSSDLARRLEIQ